LPADLFTHVIENLLQNALDKRGGKPLLRIEARLEPAAGQNGKAVLTVCDDGDPIPDPLANDLFREPVHSESGYGIGLFQAARQAEVADYELQLGSNRPGSVCLRLAPR
jgi:signal transduction histidine kinase